MAQPVYVAVYERDRWSPAWNVWIEGVAGVHTFGTRLAQARANVRDALALWLDADGSSLEISEEIRLPEGAEEAVEELKAAREHLSVARRRVTASAARAVQALIDTGLSTRDAGELLGLSHQRVSQVAAGDRPESRDGGI